MSIQNYQARICLVEFRTSGHHPFYLANFADTFHRLECKVDIFTPDTERCIETLRKALPDLNVDRIGFVHTDASPVGKRRSWGCRAYFNLLKLEAEIRQYEKLTGQDYSLVFFAYLDDISHKDFALPYLFRTPFKRKYSGLLVSPRNKVLRKAPFFVDFILTSILEHRSIACEEIGLLVEDVSEEIEQRTRIPSVLYPDFCSSTPLRQVSSPINDEIIHRQRGRRITSLLGSIQPHKSIDLLLECIRVADPAIHFFVIAGYFHQSHFSVEQWQEIEKILNDPPENLLISNEWLESEAIFDTIVQQSDYLFAFYRNFKKSSNILTKGAFYGKPVIVSDQYLMGSRVRKYQLGFALSEEKVPEIYLDGSLEQFAFDDEKRDTFVSMNSVSRLELIFQNLLQKTGSLTIGDAQTKGTNLPMS